MSDEILMPFGKYKGTPIDEIPANYLLWLHDQFEEKGVHFTHEIRIRDWINENLQHLKDLRETGMGEQ